MNKVINDELNRFAVVRSLDEETLNEIVKIYPTLTLEEQHVLSFLWTIEEIIHKNKLKSEGKSPKDIKREDTCLYKLIKVENME